MGAGELRWVRMSTIAARGSVDVLASLQWDTTCVFLQWSGSHTMVYYFFFFTSSPLLLPRLWDVPPKSRLWKLKSFLYWSAIQNSFSFFCIGLENKWWTKILFTKPKYNLSPFSWYYWKTAKLSYLLNDASQWSAKTESQFTLACNFLTDAKKRQGAPFD